MGIVKNTEVLVCLLSGVRCMEKLFIDRVKRISGGIIGEEHCGF